MSLAQAAWWAWALDLSGPKAMFQASPTRYTLHGALQYNNVPREHVARRLAYGISDSQATWDVFIANLIDILQCQGKVVDGHRRGRAIIMTVAAYVGVKMPHVDCPTLDESRRYRRDCARQAEENHTRSGILSEIGQLQHLVAPQGTIGRKALQGIWDDRLLNWINRLAVGTGTWRVRVEKYVMGVRSTSGG